MSWSNGIFVWLAAPATKYLFTIIKPRSTGTYIALHSESEIEFPQIMAPGYWFTWWYWWHWGCCNNVTVAKLQTEIIAYYKTKPIPPMKQWVDVHSRLVLAKERSNVGLGFFTLAGQTAGIKDFPHEKRIPEKLAQLTSLISCRVLLAKIGHLLKISCRT